MPKAMSRKSVIENLQSIELSAKQALQEIDEGKDCFGAVCDIHALANDIHETMDEGHTKHVFKPAKKTISLSDTAADAYLMVIVKNNKRHIYSENGSPRIFGSDAEIVSFALDLFGKSSVIKIESIKIS